MKRHTDDWSIREIQKILREAITLTVRSLCIFIDGLDEFDQDDDIDLLLDLVENLSASVKVKICMSSRPENYLIKRLSRYRQLKLQDLTTEYIHICIRDGLESARKQCRPASITKERFDEIVSTVKDKSDGVFLWVHYALSSLIRGLRNDDDFNDLLDRIDGLPSGMQQLYLQMWKRLNEDEQRYRDEAAVYFSYGEYFSDRGRLGSLSLFEMLVALDESLQNNYISFIEPQDPAYIAEMCQKMRNSTLTRCAGLLEFGDVEDARIPRADSCDATSISSEGSVGSGESDTETFKNSDTWPSASLLNKDLLYSCHRTYLKYIHRTAADFFTCTKEGEEILGHSQTSADSRFRNVLRAMITSLIQNSDLRQERAASHMIDMVGEYESSNEIELLTNLKQVCTKLGISRYPIKFIKYTSDGYGRFNPDISLDFESAVAAAGCGDFVRHIVINETPNSSPYYLGYLFLCAMEIANEADYHRPDSGRLSLMSWLILQGGDVFTKHSPQWMVFVPGAEFLFSLTNPSHNSLSKGAFELTQRLVPSLNKSASRYVVILARVDDWQMNGH